jgi:aspartoacylase
MGKVLVVGGTHGNECNAPWLLRTPRPDEGGLNKNGLDTAGLAVLPLLGNPEALAAGRRYLDRDLNRSFEPALVADPSRGEHELGLARRWLDRYGPLGKEPCLVALDLHSTTAAMGNCLVAYGRRPGDLALAAALQHRLGLPLYLHEGDPAQSGYLVESWPCGLVIEVGPVPQGVIQARVVEQTRLALEEALALLAQARQGVLPQPRELVVHLHHGSLDLPRHPDGSAAAVVHPQRQNRDWQPLRAGDPLFLDQQGRTLVFEPPAELAGQTVCPVFVNEAAYGEKGIAFSLTSRQTWPVRPEWAEALIQLARGLEAA